MSYTHSYPIFFIIILYVFVFSPLFLFLTHEEEGRRERGEKGKIKGEKEWKISKYPSKL
jgi:hypothetical protein